MVTCSRFVWPSRTTSTGSLVPTALAATKVLYEARAGAPAIEVFAGAPAGWTRREGGFRDLAGIVDRLRSDADDGQGDLGGKLGKRHVVSLLPRLDAGGVRTA
jgi:hypothetical protein